ncbi:MAG TPA: nucleotidyltransferase domain-containing protein [Saprospiraceae bacterium]|nr:nucleotidyltransferase domain-containing protein [Saprospiraceae bacterium]
MVNKLDKKGIVQFLSDNKQILRETFYIEQCTLVGSIANDTYTSKSDVDIVYQLIEGKNLNFNLYMQLIYWLEKNLGRSVDLINSKNINPVIKLNFSCSAQVVI